MRQLVLFSFFVWIALPLAAQCFKGNCDNGHGSFEFKDGSKYEGQFKNGLIWGQGIYYYPNGDKYLGEWKKNRKHGKGKLIFHTGETYLGEFRRDQFHGKGKLEYTDGRVYEGTWDASTPIGEGLMIMANGSRQRGHWEDGVWVSDQTTTEPAHTIEVMINDEQSPKKNCNRTYCHEEGGYYIYSDGSRYEGWFVDGHPQGKGRCLYASGDQYVGEWKKDSPNGEGVMYFSSGRVYGAVWDMGKPVGILNPEEPTEYRSDIQSVSSEEVRVWAVVLGVSRYQHMPVLNYSDDDAYRFYAFLKSPEGGALPDEQIAILIDEDATKEAILRRMQEVVFKADENDVVMVYFSGHGLDGSFLPIDYDGYNNTLSYEDITEILKRSKAKYKMCFADACHSGSMMAQKSVDETVHLYYNAFKDIGRGTAFMLSSKAEEFSLEDGGLRQGVFSHFLIKGIKGVADMNQDKIITIGELFKYVRFEVRRYSGNLQTPVMIGQYDENMPVGVLRQ